MEVCYDLVGLACWKHDKCECFINILSRLFTNREELLKI